MKNLLYDLIVGGAILAGLIGIVPIMTANQNYIRNSAVTKSGNERLDVVYSDSGFEKNQYDITDVYAFVLQNINEQRYITDKIRIEFIFNETGIEKKIIFTNSSLPEDVSNNVNILATYLKQTTIKYTIDCVSTEEPTGILKTYTIKNK